jgi:4a-hydroxytetrahydrobiopterin dehydratase
MTPIDPDALSSAIAGLLWSLEGNELVKVVRKADFAEALQYVNEVGRLAEEAQHHPDIDIRWNTVTLRQSTHSVGGITALDVALARSIDELDG